MTGFASLLLGAGLGTGILLVVHGLRGRAALGSVGSFGSSGTAVAPDRMLRLAALVVGAAVATYLLTGWPVAAVGVASATLALPRALGGASRHRAEIARVEAIATWAEQLRDTVAAANGLEHAIGASAAVAPAPLATPLARLATRLEYEPLPAALRAFADDVDHPAADFVVAGLVVAAEKEARELGPLLGQLAESARAEAQLRARVWAGRARTRTSVRVISACVGLFAAGLVLFDRAYLEPYGSATGQLVLVAVIAMFAGSFVAMDRMGRIELPQRFLGRRARAGVR